MELADHGDSMHFWSARRMEMSDTEVTIKSMLLVVFTFIAGYLVALLRERIALRRQRAAERPYRSSEEQHS